MATTFRCPCGQFFQVPATRTGVIVKCPRCQNLLQIGAANPAPPPPVAVSEPTPRQQPAAELPRPQRPAPEPPAPAPQIVVPPAPPRPKRQPDSSAGPLVAGVVAGVAGLAVLVGVLFAFRSTDTATSASTPVVEGTTPQQSTRPAPTFPQDTGRVPTGKTTPKPPDPPKDDPRDKPPPDKPVVVKPEDLTRFIEQLNARREAAGVLPVKIDIVLTKGCQSHADYLVRHSVPPTRAATEQEGQTGFSEAGVEAARVALISFADPPTALVQWFAAPDRRPLLLSPELQLIGVGAASGGGRTATVIDVQRGRASRKPQVIVYPPDGDKDIPLAFPGREVPDPVPEAKGTPTGYPITVTFPYGTRIQKAQGVLRGPNNQEVAAWFSAPGKPANPEYPNHQGPCLCLIGKNVFEPDSAYTAEFQADINGKAWAQTVRFTTISHNRPPPDLLKSVVQRINRYRRLAKLNDVILDDDLTKGCQAHALYLARHEERPNLNANDEDSSLPGYTREGKAAAQRASIGITSFDPASTIDSWASMFHYRFPVLDPQATRVGIGITRSPRSWHLVIVNEQGGNNFTSPLIFPVPDQTDVPLYYAGGEGPPPIPRDERAAGFPVSVQFPERMRVLDATAELYKDGDKAPVAAYVTTPQKYLVNASYQKNSIILIAKGPLQANTRYEARFKARVDGQPWEKKWTFRTQGDDLDSQRDLALQSVAELNRHRKALGLMPVALQEDLSHGCLAHARYLSTNFGHPTLAGLGMHDEQPNLPGFSPQGKAAAKESVIAMGSPPVASIEAWINTFYHRIPLLDPDLASVGVGFAQGSNPRWYVVLITSNEHCRERLVVYPPNGGSDVPAKDCPITVTVYGKQAVTQADLKLFDAEGTEVVCDVQLPDNLKLNGAEKNTVALTPRAGLKPGARYVVKGKLQGGTRTWTINSGFRVAGQ